jgi:hypothetical protein
METVTNMILTSPLKKTINLISLSYPWKEREIKLIDALLPLRRPTNERIFKGHDSLRGELKGPGFAGFPELGEAFINLTPSGLRVGVVGDDQTPLI